MTIAAATDLAATLDAEERHVMDELRGGAEILATPGPEGSGAAVFVRYVPVPSRRRPRPERERVEGAVHALRRLVRAGWLRFVPMDEGFGWFWPTDEAERVWGMLR